MLTAGLRCAPDTRPMNKMIAITISPGATTAAVRLIVSGNACPIMPPPAATSTRKNVPSNSEKSRRHSWDESWKSWTVSSNVVSRRPKYSQGVEPSPAPDRAVGAGRAHVETWRFRIMSPNNSRMTATAFNALSCCSVIICSRAAGTSSRGTLA